MCDLGVRGKRAGAVRGGGIYMPIKEKKEKNARNKRQTDKMVVRECEKGARL